MLRADGKCDPPVRWGIVGTGNMAGQFVRDLAMVPDATVVAVASRDPARARWFAQQHGIGCAVAGHAAVVGNAEVDVVYIATEHVSHHELALAAVAAGKHVVVEKPFACTAAAARAVVEAARQRQRFCMEAQWTRFLPALLSARQLVHDGALGDVQACRFELGATHAVDPASRLFAPARGGGALLELGVHTLAMATHLFGPGRCVSARVEPTGTGVDGAATLQLEHAGGVRSDHFVTLVGATANRALVTGTRAGLVLAAGSARHGFTLERPAGGTSEFVAAPARGLGYVYEIEEVMCCLRAGRTESEAMPLADTLAVLAIVDHALGVG